MSYSLNQVMPPQTSPLPLVLLNNERRARFILRTYLHLLGALIIFILIEAFLFQSGLAQPIIRSLLGFSWLTILGGFMVVGWLASSISRFTTSLLGQYLVLALFILVESIFFLPLLFVAETQLPGIIQNAAAITLIGFTGLTAVVFVIRQDFSFLNSMLLWAGIVALLMIIAGLLFDFELGTWVSIAMIAVAGGSILRNTSRILRSYPEDRYVAAALNIFASLVLLFWAVLRLPLRRR